MILRRGLAVAALLGLSGCVTVPPRAPSPQPDWNAIKLERQALKEWQLKGRAAVSTAADGWNAGFDWRQTGERFELKLQGALGIGGLVVRSDGEALRIETSRGESVSGEEASRLLEGRLGMALPLKSLRFWLLGVPEPVVPALSQLNADGRLGQLNQGGWMMLYDRYIQQNGNWMPGRVQLEKEGVKVRVVVDRWTF